MSITAKRGPKFGKKKATIATSDPITPRMVEINTNIVMRWNSLNAPYTG